MTNPLYYLTDMVEPKAVKVRDPFVTDDRKIWNSCLELLIAANKNIKRLDYTITPVLAFNDDMEVFDYHDVNAKTGESYAEPRDYEIRIADELTLKVLKSLKKGRHYNVLSYYENNNYYWVTAIEIDKRRRDLS